MRRFQTQVVKRKQNPENEAKAKEEDQLFKSFNPTLEEYSKFQRMRDLEAKIEGVGRQEKEPPKSGIPNKALLLYLASCIQEFNSTHGSVVYSRILEGFCYPQPWPMVHTVSKIEYTDGNLELFFYDSEPQEYRDNSSDGSGHGVQFPKYKKSRSVGIGLNQPEETIIYYTGSDSPYATDSSGTVHLPDPNSSQF